MGSIFHSDYSGVVTLLVCMIVLVMFGVFATLLVDGTVSLPRKQDHEVALEADRVAIEHWKAKNKALEEERAERESFREIAAAAEEVRTLLGTAKKEVVALRAEVRDGEGALAALAAEYDRYRDRYRTRIHRSAIGTFLGTVTTLEGKVMKNVKVRGLNPTEMRVMHEAGPATIPVTELPAELRERFHLDAEEAVRLVQERKQRAQEKLRLLQAEREREREADEKLKGQEREALRHDRVAGLKGESTLTEEESARLRSLRAEVGLLYIKLGALRRELATARARIGGPDRSPPGSLQTWEERAAELLAREVRGMALIQSKEAEIRELDPSYRSSRR